MTTYHKGTLYLNSELNGNWFVFGNSNHGVFLYYGFSLFNRQDYFDLSYNDRNYFGNFFIQQADYSVSKIKNSKVNVILDNLLNQHRYLTGNEKSFNIIFEKFCDSDGVIYGKELYTGLIFPLVRQSVFRNYEYNMRKKIVGSGSQLNYELQTVFNYNIPSLSL